VPHLPEEQIASLFICEEFALKDEMALSCGIAKKSVGHTTLKNADEPGLVSSDSYVLMVSKLSVLERERNGGILRTCESIERCPLCRE